MKLDIPHIYTHVTFVRKRIFVVYNARIYLYTCIVLYEYPELNVMLAIIYKAHCGLSFPIFFLLVTYCLTYSDSIQCRRQIDVHNYVAACGK